MPVQCKTIVFALITAALFLPNAFAQDQELSSERLNDLQYYRDAHGSNAEIVAVDVVDQNRQEQQTHQHPSPVWRTSLICFHRAHGSRRNPRRTAA